MNKKANIPDILFLCVIFFSIVIGSLATFKAFDDVAGGLNTTESGLTNNSIQRIEHWRLRMPKIIDDILVVTFFGAFLAIAVSAFLIRSNFVFFFTAVIVVAVFAFIVAVLSNAYESYVTSNVDLQAYVTNNFRLTNHIMNNWVIYVVIMSFIVLVALYAKLSSNRGDGI